MPVAVCLLAVGGYFFIDKLRNASEGEIDMVALRSLALKILQKVWATAIAGAWASRWGARRQPRQSTSELAGRGRLRDADPQVQAQAARALGVIGNRGATAALLHQADEGGDQRSGFRRRILAKLGAPASKSLLLRSLEQDRYPQVRPGGTGAWIWGRPGKDTACDAAWSASQTDRRNAGGHSVTSTLLLGDDEAKTQLIQIARGATEPAAPAPGGADISRLAMTARATCCPAMAVQPGKPASGGGALRCVSSKDKSISQCCERRCGEPGAGMPQRLLAAQGIGHCGDKQDATEAVAESAAG
ncbi:MAG: HEAT repeat domain-containing protein [Polyangia bacterium]